MTEIVHAAPPPLEILTPCCRKTAFELPADERMTLDAATVTCGREPDHPHVEQLAMFMQRRDAFDQGIVVNGNAHPTWEELAGLGGHESYLRDARAFIAAMTKLGWKAP